MTPPRISSRGQSALANGSIREPINIVLDALRAARCDPEKKKDHWEAKCPAHDDSRPSLDVKQGHDGKVLVTCHSQGCTFTQIAAALNLEETDFFRRPHTNGKAKGKAKPRGRIDYDHPVAIYVYENPRRIPAFQVRRLNVLDPTGKIIDKTFLQYRPDGTGWTLGLGGIKPILYRLPELLAADPALPVWFLEGEKDVNNLRVMGLVATTNPMGAGNWKDSYAEWFRGRHVIIIPDNDQVGRNHAQQVAQSLHGVAASVKIVELPGLPPKGDATDFLEAGGTVEQLAELAHIAPFWVPDPENAECADSADDSESEYWPPLRLRDLPKPGVFPLDVLPDACVKPARAIATAVGCDVASVAGSMLAMAAGLIGRTVHLELKENWYVSPILWHCNVGDPGQGKSWGQKYLTDGFLSTLQEELKDEFTALKRHYLEKTKRDKKGVHDKPVPRQVLIDDATIEALFLALSHNPRGLLANLDELTVLFAGLNQYKGGKGADRSHFLKLWTGQSVTKNRVGNEFNEPLYVPHPCLSITGNIPPDNLHLIRTPQGNDGMQDRWLYTFPAWHRKLKTAERGQVTEGTMGAWDGICRQLWERQMSPVDNGKLCPHKLKFDKDGRNEFFDRMDRLADEMNDEDFPPHLRGPWAKLELYAGRLVVVLQALHTAALRAPIGEASSTIADGAWKLVDYFKGEHLRVLAAMECQSRTMPEGARLHMNWIKNHPDKEEFSERDISRDYQPNKNYDPSMMADGRLWLAQRSAIRRRPEPERDDSTPGRKPSPVWQIHPDLRTSAESAFSAEPPFEGG